MLNWKTLSVVFLGISGLMMTGCKSAPDLTAGQALSMVQAKYDQTPPVGVNILVNDPGMLRGVDGQALGADEDVSQQDLGRFQADPRGEEGCVLPDGGDMIEWRPASLDDKDYTIVVTTVAANHLKAHDMGDLQDEMVARIRHVQSREVH